MKVKGDTVIYYIGDIATGLGLSQRAIRYYEELGIISPTRTQGRFRSYSARDLDILKMVIRFKDLGMSLEDIRALIVPGKEALKADLLRALRQTLSLRREEFEQKIKKYEEGIEQIDHVLNVLLNCTKCGKPAEQGVCEECLRQRGEDVSSLLNPLPSQEAEQK